MLARLAARSNSAVRVPLTVAPIRTYAQAPKKPQQPTPKPTAKTSSYKAPTPIVKKATTPAAASAATSASQSQAKAKEAAPTTAKAAATKTAAPKPQPAAYTSTQKASGAASAGIGAKATASAASTPKPAKPAPSAAKPAAPEPDVKSSTPPTPETKADPAPQKPLPDLRQGIPSTFAAEFGKSSKTAESSAAPEQDPNITEDGSDNPQASNASGSGGSRSGELPRSAYETSGDRLRNRVANWTYLSIALFGVTGAVYLGRNWDTEEEENTYRDAPNGWGFQLMYDRARTRLSSQMGYYTEPNFPKLLPEIDPQLRQPYTLVLSLEDLLVHSEWTREHGWRTAKRPGVDYFIR